MTVVDAISAVAVPDYKFIGQTKNSLWGKFVTDQDQNWTQAQRQEWHQQQKRIRQQRAAEEARQRAEALAPIERDRFYRQLLDQLTLHPIDRKDLQRRGLTDEQIAVGEFRSVEQWQRLETELSHQLPGVNLDGLSLNTQAGYLCPIKDADGFIVGCQIRLRDANDGGRYRWLTSATKKRPNGPTPHLSSGELPLAVHKPQVVRLNTIGMTEGTGAKPFIAAQRLGQIVIGAAGGQFATSPQALKTTLENLSASLSTQTIVFYVDAGSVTNRQVIRQYRATWELLQQWGYQITIGWWGQTDKSHPDIDELNDYSAIVYITPDEFLAMIPACRLDPSKRERTLSADEWYWRFGLPNWFRDKLTKLPQVFKGFGKPPTPKTTISKTSPKAISYTPGERVPTREEYEAIGSPTIRFAREHRLQLYAELVAAGWQHILDKSGTGSGKSHDVGLARPEQFGVSKLLYFAEDHRNPTVATIEANFIDLPVRHDGDDSGLVEDSNRQTALGNVYRRWAQNGEEPTLPGNCHRAGLFHALANKGYSEAATAAESNPICNQCQHNWSCGKASALVGSNYRALRAKALKSSCIRLNIESAPDIGNEAGGFWEEASRLVKPTQAVEARLTDFDRLFADLETKAPDVHNKLTHLRQQLRRFLAGGVELTQETRHGWNDAALRDVLGAPPEDLEGIIEAFDAIKPDFKQILLTDQVPSDQSSGVGTRAAKRLNKLFRRHESYDASKQQLESLPTNWLLPLLRVWGNLQPGAIRISGGTLSITTRNHRPAEIAQGLKFSVYLDATANREFLARFLDISAADVVQVEQEPARFDNLKIVQITGLGLAGRERSDSLKQRIAALKAELQERHADIGIIEHKSHVEKGDGWWFNHNRGSNEYQDCSALASVGTPYQNVGALQDIYITLTGDRDVNKDAPGFSAFVQWLTQSEFIQTANRLRANRRSEEQELPYYAATEIDLEFLQEYYPGCKIERVDAFDITPTAGSATQQSHWKIQQAILAAAQQTGKAIENLTQTEAAKFAQVTQGRIAQVASKYGGWKAFLKLLASLLESIYTTTNNSPENNSPLDEDQEYLARTYLPLVAVEDPPDTVEALLVTVQSHGWRVFEAILQAADPETKSELVSRLLGMVLSGLPDILKQGIRAAAIADGG